MASKKAIDWGTINNMNTNIKIHTRFDPSQNVLTELWIGLFYNIIWIWIVKSYSDRIYTKYSQISLVHNVTAHRIVYV